LRLTLLSQAPSHRFSGLRSEEHRPLPRWSRFRTLFLAERRSSSRNANLSPRTDSHQRYFASLACG
jgi:hypothetical protein